MCESVWRWKSSLVAGWLRADSHYTSRFRSVAERQRSVKFSYMYLNGYVHTDRNVSVKSQFRSVAERECLTGRNGSEPVWTSSILLMWTVQRLVQYASSVCLQRVLPGFSSEMDEKLVELVRKCPSVPSNILIRRRNGTETWRRRSCQCEYIRLNTCEKILLNGDVPRRNGNVTIVWISPKITRHCVLNYG